MIKQVLMGSNYWVLNKSVVKELGLEVAFILSNLVEADNMMADKDGWFYQTSDTLEILTGFKKDKQTKLLRKLIKLGLLLQKNKGIPQKRYFKIDYKAVESIVYSKTANYTTEISSSILLESSNNKESINKESINKETLVQSQLDKNFEIFWKQYNKKKAKKKCLAKWKLLKVSDRKTIMEVLPCYLKMESDIKYRPHPLTFLNGELWNDEITTDDNNNGKPKDNRPKSRVVIGFERGKPIYED